MKILLATYPMAHQTPGGGEIQIFYYKKYLSKLGYKVSYFDQWKDKINKFDLVHFFFLCRWISAFLQICQR